MNIPRAVSALGTRSKIQVVNRVLEHGNYSEGQGRNGDVSETSRKTKGAFGDRASFILGPEIYTRTNS